MTRSFHFVSVITLMLILVLVGRVSAQAESQPQPRPETALKDYVSKVDTSYTYSTRGQSALGASEFIELSMTSQTWQGKAWQHQLYVIKPAVVRHPQQMVLVIAGGRWDKTYLKRRSDGQVQLPKSVSFLALAAQQLGSPIAVLMQVPFQPLFDGKTEDAIIAYTFDKYLRTSQSEWPLLLPMVKSAVRAMDTLQDYAQANWDTSVQGFTVTGGSKRGWTTWLTAAVDDRVKAIVPMVIDMLNLGEHGKHQIKTWGSYSPSVKDYTRLKVMQRMDSPVGRQLLQIVDPYAYRHLLTLPKLIMLGTNDPFWPVDALSLYWEGLPSQKYITTVPNAGHGLNKDYRRIVGSLVAMHQHSVGEQKLAQLQWQFDQTDSGLDVTLSSDVRPVRVLAWSASEPKRDFRQAKWTSETLAADGKQQVYAYHLPAAVSGQYKAVMLEAWFNGKSLPYSLSTPVHVLGDGEKQ